jgi:hypothetical protein
MRTKATKRSAKNQWDQGWECPQCKMVRGKDGHDPCLGKLPGVIAACCGHGGTGEFHGYIYFENGKIIRWGRKKIEVESDE